MTFSQIIAKLRDGKAYDFSHENLPGFFYKAPPLPIQEVDTEADVDCSAITYWDKKTLEPASPCLMLYDFDTNANWTIEEATKHPTLR